MKQFFMSAAFLCISVTLISAKVCLDNGGDKPSMHVASESAKSKIVDRDFLLVEYTYTFNDTVKLTIAEMDDCTKDDVTRFLDNFSGTIYEGATKCDSLGPQMLSFTWSLISNDTKIKLNIEGDEETYDIKINNGTILTLEHIEVEDIDLDGKVDKGVLSVTYSKK